MKKTTTFLLTLALLTGLATATSITEQDKENLKEQWNEEETPRYIALLISGETVNFELEGEYLAVEFSGTEIVQIDEKEREDATTEIKLTQEAVEQVTNAEEPVEEFKEQKEKGNIEIKQYETETEDEETQQQEAEEETTLRERVSQTASNIVTSARVTTANLVL